jgi:hypothetical protein
MTSNGGKLYMKIVAFNEIYNFVVQSFLFEVIFIVYTLSRSQFSYLDLSFEFTFKKL